MAPDFVLLNHFTRFPHIASAGNFNWFDVRIVCRQDGEIGVFLNDPATETNGLTLAAALKGLMIELTYSLRAMTDEPHFIYDGGVYIASQDCFGFWEIRYIGDASSWQPADEMPEKADFEFRWQDNNAAGAKLFFGQQVVFQKKLPVYSKIEKSNQAAGYVRPGDWGTVVGIEWSSLTDCWLYHIAIGGKSELQPVLAHLHHQAGGWITPGIHVVDHFPQGSMLTEGTQVWMLSQLVGSTATISGASYQEETHEWVYEVETHQHRISWLSYAQGHIHPCIPVNVRWFWPSNNRPVSYCVMAQGWEEKGRTE